VPNIHRRSYMAIFKGKTTEKSSNKMSGSRTTKRNGKKAAVRPHKANRPSRVKAKKS
jgi:hypothetical protein